MVTSDCLDRIISYVILVRLACKIVHALNFLVCRIERVVDWRIEGKGARHKRFQEYIPLWSIDGDGIEPLYRDPI